MCVYGGGGGAGGSTCGCADGYTTTATRIGTDRDPSPAEDLRHSGAKSWSLRAGKTSAEVSGGGCLHEDPRI